MEIKNKLCETIKCINNVDGICRADLKLSKWCENINHITTANTVMMEEGLFFKPLDNHKN